MVLACRCDFLDPLNLLSRAGFKSSSSFFAAFEAVISHYLLADGGIIENYFVGERQQVKTSSWIEHKQI
jgi:hypothetical protein